MTWGEFKKTVEDSGVTDGMDIWYIDISHIGDASQLSISLQEDSGPNEIGVAIT